MKTRIAVAAIATMLVLPSGLEAQRRPNAPAIDDAAIVGIFDAANSWDISTGTLAGTRASSPEVKALGEMLARDHKTVQKQGRELATKLGVTPTPVAADFALRKDHEAAMKRLTTLKGPAFDRAFLEHEIAYHKSVIDAVTTSFLPAITNTELRAFVTKVAPAFQAHQLAAENLLKGLK